MSSQGFLSSAPAKRKRAHDPSASSAVDSPSVPIAGGGDGGGAEIPRRFLPKDAPRLASNRGLRKLWAREANRVLAAGWWPEHARIMATRKVVVELDFSSTPVNPRSLDAPVVLSGAAGRRQRWTAGSGEGVGEIAERAATGRPALPYAYEGPGGRAEAVLLDAEERRRSEKARRAGERRRSRAGRGGRL
jgi:hypothetical protein